MSGSKQQTLQSSMARVFNMGSILGGSNSASTSSLASGAGGGKSSAGGSGKSSDGSNSGGKKGSSPDMEFIVKKGYLKKYKSMKSRYFVLRRQSGPNGPASLEYYDNESKFLEGHPPRRQYLLNQCIRIQEKKVDSKRPFGVSILIKQDDCCLLASSNEELQEWLTALQNTADTSDWEHVWHVEVLNRRLGGSGCNMPLAGHCYLCLTKRQLSLVKQDDYKKRTDIALTTVRQCRLNNEFFYLEMGRLAVTGSGGLWLKTQDSNIAANMYNIVGKAMTDLWVTSRDRTTSMSNSDGPILGRDRSGSLPCRPSLGGGPSPVPPSMDWGASGTHDLAPPHPQPVTPAAMQSPAKWHPPWDTNLSRSKDDGRGSCVGNCCSVIQPNLFSAMPMHSPTQQQGAGEGDGNYLIMDPKLQSQRLVLPSVTLVPGQHSSTCNDSSISSIHCTTPLREVAEEPLSSTPQDENSTPMVVENYIDMAKGSGGALTPSSLSSPAPPTSCSSAEGLGFTSPLATIPVSSPVLCPHGLHVSCCSLCSVQQQHCIHSHHHHHPCCPVHHHLYQQHTVGSLVPGHASNLPSSVSPLPAHALDPLPSSQLNSNSAYIDMTPTNATQPKPIPGSPSNEEHQSPNSACSSLTSGAATPSSDRLERCSSSQMCHDDATPTTATVTASYNSRNIAGSATASAADAADGHTSGSNSSSMMMLMMAGNSNMMDTDSVHEDSVDDILDALSGTRRRLDSFDRQREGGSGGDVGVSDIDDNDDDEMDLDMDMDQDQVDSGPSFSASSSTSTANTAAIVHSSSSSISTVGGGSVSARGCLETSGNSSCGGAGRRMIPGAGGGSSQAYYGAPPSSSYQYHPPMLHDEDELTSLDRPIRTSSVGSKPELIRRKNSAPMLGISCTSRSWSDTSGSYFRNLFNTRSHDKQREGLMMLDFTKNHKSYDHIGPGGQPNDDSKEKKSISMERFKSTFSKHRSSSKTKPKRVSEGDATSCSSRGGGIEIPGVQGDYFQLDFNPSPRSNTSNTSTNSDAPLSGYLNMRPGASLSFSSTCSADYVDMGRGVLSSAGSGSIGGVVVGSGTNIANDTGGYLEMSSPRNSIDSFYTPTVGSVCEGYVDMTLGAGGLSISADSSSSSSLNSRIRKISSTHSHVSSMELQSPQEELPEFAYLHEMDAKSLQKEKKKNRKKSSKESSKRKKSDVGSCESVAETLKSKGSSHLASISSFLTRKNSQSSSTKTPLSPTGSPLPKSSRNSNSPFASLGRSKSKESRETSNPPISQSPSSGLPTTPATLGILSGFSSSSQMSPNNFHGFLQTTINPGFRDSDTMENENYCAIDPSAMIQTASSCAVHVDASVSGTCSFSSFPRNHSNKDLPNFGYTDMSKPTNRSSGSFDFSAGMLTGCCQCSALVSPSAGQLPQSNKTVTIAGVYCGGGTINTPLHHHHQSLPQQLQQHTCCQLQTSAVSCEMKDRGCSSGSTNVTADDTQNAYVNLNLELAESNNSLNKASFSSNNKISNCCCNYSCRHLIPRLGYGDAPGLSDSHASVSVRQSSDLGRLSESSLEDCKASSTVNNIAQETASYVNMCPTSAKSNTLNIAAINRSHEIMKSATNTPPITPCGDRKILNTEQINNRRPIIADSSDYLEMDIQKSNNSSCVVCTSHQQQQSRSVSSVIFSVSCVGNVVKRPALPPLLLGSKSDPSVPLEKLSLTEGKYDSVNKSNCKCVNKSSRATLTTTTSSDNSSSSRSYCSGSCLTDASSNSERCRSYSGPGAPEASRFGAAHRTKDGIGALDVCEEVRRGEGESRALSACSSPVSYSPPTSPSLASSSKSSLSEGGMSSASSTCTVVNVGLRLQQQRKTHGSGSSTSTNTDTHSSTSANTSVNSPNPIASSIVGLSSITNTQASQVPRLSASSEAPFSKAEVQTTVTSQSSRHSFASIRDTNLPLHAKGGSSSSQKDNHDIVYACLDLAHPKRDMIHSSGSSGSANNSPASKRRNVTTTTSTTSGLEASSSSLTTTAAITTSNVTTSTSTVRTAAKAATCSLAGEEDNSAATSEASCLNYTEIDFKKSESLRNTCMLRDALRH